MLCRGPVPAAAQTDTPFRAESQVRLTPVSSALYQHAKCSYSNPPVLSVWWSVGESSSECWCSSVAVVVMEELVRLHILPLTGYQRLCHASMMVGL